MKLLSHLRTILSTHYIYEQYWTLIEGSDNQLPSLIYKYGNNNDTFIKQNWSYNERNLMSQCMNINYGEHPWIGWKIVLKGH